MDIESLVNELIAYLDTPAGKTFHAGEEHEVCRIVDEAIQAIPNHPLVKRAIIEMLMDGNTGIATHLVAHLLFDLGRLYALKQGTVAADDREAGPPVNLDENIWTSGWDSGGGI